MSRIFVGELPLDIQESELSGMFQEFGEIVEIVVKKKRDPPAFAFLQFKDPRDADDAIRKMDGCKFEGRHLRVERENKPRGESGRFGGPPDRGGRGFGGRRGYYDDYDRRDYYDDYDRRGGRGEGGRGYGRRGGYDDDRRRGGDDFYERRGGGGSYRGGRRDGYSDPRGRFGGRGPSRRNDSKTDYNLEIFNIPEGTSWQDLKDHMRDGGKYRVQYVVTYDSDPTRGRVEYATLEDMKDAYHELHNTVLKGNKIEIEYPKGSKYGPDQVPSDSEDDDDRRPKERGDDLDNNSPRRKNSPSPERRERRYSEDSYDRRPHSPNDDDNVQRDDKIQDGDNDKKDLSDPVEDPRKEDDKNEKEGEEGGDNVDETRNKPTEEEANQD